MILVSPIFGNSHVLILLSGHSTKNPATSGHNGWGDDKTELLGVLGNIF